ncbi:MAG: phosphoenolpyruvate--protein phosphotransferase [Ruminococcaceae bacterium]|nr:phosphoenolpyruvate--protein phosphotransferase [Oscillospiraceae bacterium]
MLILKGIPASGGIAIGPLYVYQKKTVTDFAQKSALTPEQEHRRVEDAVAQAKSQLDELYEKTVRDADEAAAQIFDIHKMMLDDLDYVESIAAGIDDGFTAEHAVNETAQEFSAMLLSMDDETMRARSADVQDISHRLLTILSGADSAAHQLQTASVVGAVDLFPSDTMQLEKAKLLAFVTEQGSKASHSAILARTLGIPAVVGIRGLRNALIKNETVIVDGSTGQLIIAPNDETLCQYREKQESYAKERELLNAYKDRPSITRDGVSIEVCANIAYTADAEAAVENGAEGIGLMRSEFLYMDATDFPDEETQFHAYRTVLTKLEGKRVVVRTLDIGADKVPTYLDLPHEENPALGCRAIRLCLQEEDVLRTQLRALLRASAYGKLAIMFPMISKLQELRRAKEILAECRAQLEAEGVTVSEDLEVGMMVEIPAAALLSDLFAPEVDFFSIGTNDLTQYTLATDRLNERVEPLFDYSDEAVLRLIAMTAKSAHDNGIWCGICGESAGDLELLPFYAKVGIDELSVVPNKVLEVRRAITELDVSAL